MALTIRERDVVRLRDIHSPLYKITKIDTKNKTVTVVATKPTMEDKRVTPWSNIECIRRRDGKQYADWED